mmetsp:Transcript_9270/g.56437  ORF Transcript_9270/g.56437 Transcript_9270/m.56437 type:complete len:203 (-) Transcript_9270:432-1040(-)
MRAVQRTVEPAFTFRLRNAFRSFPSAMATQEPTDGPADYPFGHVRIVKENVFHENSLAYAFVNLKPLLPGHVLVAPKRAVERFTSLTDEEVGAMWTLAKSVGHKLEAHYQANALTLAIQDGADAGQTVSHVHIHIMPRKPGDFENNDDIYDAMDEQERDMAEALKAEKLNLDIERKARTPEVMMEEATTYRNLFDSNKNEPL